MPEKVIFFLKKKCGRILLKIALEIIKGINYSIALQRLKKKKKKREPVRMVKCQNDLSPLKGRRRGI